MKRRQRQTSIAVSSWPWIWDVQLPQDPDSLLFTITMDFDLNCEIENKLKILGQSILSQEQEKIKQYKILLHYCCSSIKYLYIWEMYSTSQYQ